MPEETKSEWEFDMNGIKYYVATFFLLITITPLQMGSAAELEVGKALLTSGSVTGKRATGEIELKRRSAIYEKDEIHVGNNSKAQFRMIDKALISLLENSVLKIEKYQFEEVKRQIQY